MNSRAHRFVAVAALCFCLGDQLAVAQEYVPGDVPAPPVATQLSAEYVESLVREIEAAPDLNEAQKKQARDHYNVALAELKRAEELAARAEAFSTAVETVQQRVDEIKLKLTENKGKEIVSTSPESTLSEVEQKLSKQQLLLVGHKQELSDAELEPKKRPARRKEIRGQLLSLPARMEELSKLAETQPVDDPPWLAQARQKELEARWFALQREGPALENELAMYDAEDAADYLSRDRDLKTQRVARAGTRVKLLEERIKQLRAEAADEAVRQAVNEFIGTSPVLKPYAERNRELAEASQSIRRAYDAADDDLKEAEASLDALERQFSQTQKKVAAVGLSSAVGALLRKRGDSLPDNRDRRTAVSNRGTTIDEVQYELLEYQDERDELSDPEPLVQQIVSEVAPGAEVDRELLESATRDLLESKSEYLDSLIKNYNEVYDALVDLDSAEQQIILLTEHYRKYIDERVLWIRSGKPLTASFQVDRSDAWLFGNRVWFDVATAMWNEIRQRLPLYVAVTAILLALLLKGQRFRQQLREIADTISRPGFYSFAPTLRALLLTAAIAVAGPGLVGLFAWGLYFSTSGDELANAVGYGLCCAVCVWLPFEFARQICRPRGLGDVHFKWSDAAIKTLRRNIRWLVIVGLPLTAVTAAISAGQQSPGRDSLVRCAFIATMIVLALFLRQVLHPERGVFREYLAYHRNGWLDRLRGVWYWLSVAAPLVLAGLAFWGYYYTAQVLTWRLYSTGCFVTAIVLARALLTRWMMLRRRKLSIELARQRASAASQASEASAAAVAAGISTEQEGTDLSALNAQAQSFLATSSFLVVVVGMWWIWVPVLPALGMLDQWELWPKSVAGESLEIQKTPLAAQMAAMTEAGESAVRVNLPDTSDNYVTFADLAFAILMAVITVMCARNVPGLLEISVLQRLPLDASIRYAITSLTSYGIVMIGVVVACSTIGLRWSQVQWLATALTFGLAFGLQEMFANFVAGVIILFERPIRVGDVVTVDDVTGVVSRIRIRATSITNWDRKEYVVPNKEFITGRLLNWTLSDQVNRIVVNVGVAYGSDTEKVQQLLLKVAGENPLILKEPESRATFEGFGDNTLNFVLRTFLPSLENRLDVIHALHTAIDREFRAAGIEIAFPQRDLHIRSMPAPLAAALQEAEAKPSESLVTAADAMQSVKPAPIVLPPAQPWSASVMPDAATK